LPYGLTESSVARQKQLSCSGGRNLNFVGLRSGGPRRKREEKKGRYVETTINPKVFYTKWPKKKNRRCPGNVKNNPIEGKTSKSINQSEVWEGEGVGGPSAVSQKGDGKIWIWRLYKCGKTSSCMKKCNAT